MKRRRERRSEEKEIECKGNDYIGFDFCEGGANMIEERGVFVKWGGEECPSLGHLAGHGREREGDILVEVGGRKKIFWEKWNFGKLEFLWIVEEGKKENRKRKRNGKGKLFSWKRK